MSDKKSTKLLTGRCFLFAGLLRMMDCNFLGSLTPRCCSGTDGSLSRSTFHFRDTHVSPPATIILFLGSSKADISADVGNLKGWQSCWHKILISQRHLQTCCQCFVAVFFSPVINHFSEMVFFILDEMKPFLSIFYIPHVKLCWRN